MSNSKHINYRAGDYFIDPIDSSLFRHIREMGQMLDEKYCDGLFNRFKDREDSKEDVWWLDKDETQLLDKLVRFEFDCYTKGNQLLEGAKVQQKEWIIAKYRENEPLPLHASSVKKNSITTLFFLNDDFDGGELCFPEQNTAIVPKKGHLVIFPGSYFYPHEVKAPRGNIRMTLIGGFDFVEN